MFVFVIKILILFIYNELQILFFGNGNKKTQKSNYQKIKKLPFFYITQPRCFTMIEIMLVTKCGNHFLSQFCFSSENKSAKST